MNSFLERHGWSVVSTIGEDGSSRRYNRVSKNNHTAILMDCSGPVTPGHDVHDYIRIAQWLRSIGLNAPDIYEADLDNGFLLIEDFGDISFKAALEQGVDQGALYHLASDVLTQIATEPCPLTLPDYFQSHVHAGHRRVIDWYLPIVHQTENPDGIIQRYLEAWAVIEKSLPLPVTGFMHIDYHAENLMWLPPTYTSPLKGGGREGGNIHRCGLLDFQGAMHGPLAYDLANLLEDPRQVIDPALRAAILKNHDPAFLSWYRVLATQFHCRVIGQFIKLAMRGGKLRYLAYIPALEGYLRTALKDPLLAPLNSFFADIGLDFSGIKDLNAALKPGFIRPEAY